MRILCTNDDGIHAPGLAALERIARALSDDVWVVAPETDQSGVVAFALAQRSAAAARDLEPAFRRKGTPTDCVIMGVRHIMLETRPDLVLSGVNRGQNVAEDVSYSGTVAGAIEGTILGVPSIALSPGLWAGRAQRLKWHCAEHHAPAVIRRILEAGIAEGILVNVNFPDCEPDEVDRRRRSSTRASATRNCSGSTSAATGAAIPYFWIAFEQRRVTPGNGTDLWAIANGASRSRRCGST